MTITRDTKRHRARGQGCVHRSCVCVSGPHSCTAPTHADVAQASCSRSPSQQYNRPLTRQLWQPTLSAARHPEVVCTIYLPGISRLAPVPTYAEHASTPDRCCCSSPNRPDWPNTRSLAHSPTPNLIPTARTDSKAIISLPHRQSLIHI